MFWIGLLALAAIPQAASGSPEYHVVLDLGELSRTGTAEVRVPAGRIIVVDLVNRRPARRYRVTTAQGARMVEPWSKAQSALDEGRALSSCGETLAAWSEVLAMDEPALARSRASKGAVYRLQSRTCVVSASLAQGLWSLSAARSGALSEGETAGLAIDLLDDSAPRTWHVKLEAPRLIAVWHHTETTWMADEIVHDVVEMVSYGTAAGPGRARMPSVTVQPLQSERVRVAVAAGAGARRVDVDLDLGQGVWAPSTYTTLALRLLPRHRPRGDAGASPSTSTLADLTNPRAETMEQVNARVSDWLNRDMLSPGPHEHAALLLASLGLREAASGFSDTRATLSRMTAHLALAAALRGTSAPSIEAEVATAALDTLAGRQRAALDRLDALASRSPAGPASAWIRALRLRSTTDWRVPSQPAEASLLERIEYARALHRSLGGLHALRFVRLHDTEPVTDWARLAIHHGLSVEEGNVFAPGAELGEIREASLVHRIHRGEASPGPDLLSELNAAPGRAVTRAGQWKPAAEVIDWGTWARFYQRHLLSATVGLHRQQSVLLGQTKDLAWFRERESLHGLLLFPLATLAVNRHLAPNDGTARPARGSGSLEQCSGAASLAEQSPEVVAAWSWDMLDEECGDGPLAWITSSARQWFLPPVPPATTFDVAARFRLLGAPPFASLDRMRAMAPFDREIIRKHRWAALQEPDAARSAAVAPGADPLGAYDLAAMKDHALENPLDVAEVQRLYQPICELDADSCLDLASFLRGRRRLDEAASATRRALDDGLDRVAIANKAGWLVDYYLGRGETDVAVAVARKLADVGSMPGLITMARLLETLGRFVEAEPYYLQVAARYGRGPELRAFYRRWQARVSDGRCHDLATAMEVFPQGPEAIAQGELAGRPTEGVMPPTNGRAGTTFGDVIVGLNGYRVRNPVEFQCILEASSTPRVTATIWRIDAYVEVVGAFRDANLQPTKYSASLTR